VGLIARTRDDLEAFDAEELSTILRFVRAAEHSTAAEINRMTTRS
jgi:hypothetical protein